MSTDEHPIRICAYERCREIFIVENTQRGRGQIHCSKRCTWNAIALRKKLGTTKPRRRAA